MSTNELPPVKELRRVAAPGTTPQALCWRQGELWIGSRDLRRVYGVNASDWKVFKDIEAPGIPWAAVSIGETIRFNLGLGTADDRYLINYDAPEGRWSDERVAVPDFTGSYISYDGQHIYLSQWYKHRILKLDATGAVLATYDIGAEISGHTFVDGACYVLRGTEQDGERWQIARFQPAADEAEIKDVARVPFACRSLTYDGEHFWTNHRAVNETVCFDLP